MLTREELIRHCLSYPAAYEDYPFGDGEWTVMRHRANKKSFALIYEREGAVWINVKCEPERAAFFRTVYPAVRPGYHMNKTHWNTIVMDGSMAEEDIYDMIGQSYDLIKPKLKRAKKGEF